MASSLRKPFKHFETYGLFYSSKVAYNSENTQYIQNGQVSTGTPDILWTDTAFIDDIAKIWNQGRFYAGSMINKKIATASQNVSLSWDKAIITIVDKARTNSLVSKSDIFSEYPGIIPSIVLYGPNDQKNDMDIMSLVSKGCDTIASSTTSEGSTFNQIQESIVSITLELEKHGYISNCYKWNTSNPSADQCNFMSLYQEYAFVEDGGYNTRTSNNMKLSSCYVTTANSADDYIATAVANGGWAIIVIDSSVLSSSVIEDIYDVVNDYVTNGSGAGYDAIYLQMNDALKAFASEFNIVYNAELPFRVYKDGTVDAYLSGPSIDRIIEYIHIPDLSKFPLLGDDVDTAYAPMDNDGVSFLPAETVDTVDVDWADKE